MDILHYDSCNTTPSDLLQGADYTFYGVIYDRCHTFTLRMIEAISDMKTKAPAAQTIWTFQKFPELDGEMNNMGRCQKSWGTKFG